MLSHLCVFSSLLRFSFLICFVKRFVSSGQTLDVTVDFFQCILSYGVMFHYDCSCVLLCDERKFYLYIETHKTCDHVDMNVVMKVNVTLF